MDIGSFHNENRGARARRNTEAKPRISKSWDEGGPSGDV